MRARIITSLFALAVCSGGLLRPASAHAFCGFYVGSAGAELTNRATMVVMMRDGTRTVLSMRNHYEGPPEGFAMVVPVPAVLAETDVRVLTDEVFDRVDTLAAPRLVEYWEQDPCALEQYGYDDMPGSVDTVECDSEGGGGGGGSYQVRIEAQFAVGEYDIVILSAEDSVGLERWLHDQGYAIPAGASAALRPYVEAGTKFFVARVDPARITTWRDGHAVLSPLRVQYESQQFNLPVRLGLVNSDGAQDLVVHVLAHGTRYEAANYDNVTIPTNVVVRPEVREAYGSFYASLFDRVMAEHPNAVVTEYAWGSGSCDPCPGPVLSVEDLVTLGLDVLQGDSSDWVLTRLHYRYERGSLGQDLVFRAAEPIGGGRGTPNAEGAMQREVAVEGFNNFQARYVMLHPFEGEITCESPQHGRWGGPPNGEPPRAARDLAFAPRDGHLEAFLASDLPELQVWASARTDVALDMHGARVGGGCGSCGRSSGSYVLGQVSWLPLMLIAIRVRRRR